MSAQRLPADRANPLTVRHHSIIAMLEPEKPLPQGYRIHILPVNVQFDLEWGGLNLTSGALSLKRTSERGQPPAAVLSRASP